MPTQIEPSTTNVALLAGGNSGERKISLASGEGALTALNEAGYNVTVLDPAKREDLVELINGNFDVAFMCMHGKGGEDGTLQGFLESIDLPYTCSGIWSSATAIDKAVSKMFYTKAGVPTPTSLEVFDEHEKTPAQIIEVVGEKCVVKADTEGSALGVYIVEGEEQIADALKQVFAIDSKALIETFIEGDEFTVAVLGNEDTKALPVIQIIPQKNSFYDFESKYAPGGSKHLCPAPIDAELTEQLQLLATKAHKALDCRGVSRTDILVDAKGDCWVLETNTIPGMTATSLLPDAARAAGMEFSELCTELIRLAMEKQPTRL